MTDRIDHAAEAVSALVGGSHVSAEGVGRAQVHATLAVAEQLRVANLIAYTAMLDGQYNAGNARGEVDVSFAVTQDELNASLMRRELAQAQAGEALGLG